MMRTGRFLLLGGAILFVLSCSLPQGTDAPAASSIGQPRVFTDDSRNQGVYVSESGVQIDISGLEGPDGQLVSCVEAVDIVVLDAPSVRSKGMAGTGQVKALIIGRRADGQPGVWEVRKDDSIQPLQDPKSLLPSSLLPENGDPDRRFRRSFGWSYTAVDAETDGEGTVIIVGLAENLSGFRHGRWNVEPGTLVGVYWTVRQAPNGRFYLVSLAEIIGTPSDSYSFLNYPIYRPALSGGTSHLLRLFRSRLASLKLFLLGLYDAYLTDVYAVTYNLSRERFEVDGLDQDGKPAFGYIHPDRSVLIEPKEDDPNPPSSYERIVIETFNPAGPLSPGGDPAITLYDAGGVELAARDVVGGYETLDYTGGLETGTYYIRINVPPTGAFGAYAVRVLTLGLGDAVPAQPTLGTENTSDAPYEPDDTMSSAVPVSPGGVLNRYLNSVADVDWLELTLP